jgi:hypothetical protein
MVLGPKLDGRVVGESEPTFWPEMADINRGCILRWPPPLFDTIFPAPERLIDK